MATYFITTQQLNAVRKLPVFPRFEREVISKARYEVIFDSTATLAYSTYHKLHVGDELITYDLWQKEYSLLAVVTLARQKDRFLVKMETPNND
jgi:hypothetical protein